MKNKKLLRISLVVILLGSVFLGVNSVKAQQSLPTGGTSFETAVKLEPGNYQGGELPDSTGVFYSVQVGAGQKIEAKGVFVPASSHFDTLVSISLYNSDKEQIVSSGWDNGYSPSVSLLSSSKNATSQYYVKVSNDAIWDIKSYSLDINLIDNYDANSQTDAGDNFGNALAIIAPGQYQSYLSGEEEDNHEEIDFRDFYKITVKKGQTLTVNITPPLEAKMQLTLYNTKRVLIKTIDSENAGAIISHSFDVINNGDVFAKVVCMSEYTFDTIPYELGIAVEKPGEENQVIGQKGNDSKSGGLFSSGASSPFRQSSIFLFFKSSKWFRGGFLLLWILFYIYFALCLQALAQKTKTTNAWLAWIPIANIFLMLQIAQKPLWWILLLLVPLVNIVVGVIVWMKIAERRGKPNWWGILTIVPAIGILVPGYLAFSDGDSSKIETTEPYIATGTEAANKPTVGYKHACKYCGKMIPPNSTVCPFCGKVNPLGPFRCPRCHEPVETDWKVCPKCNQELRIVCPFCGKVTFFGDYCDNCGKRLLVTCPHCGQEQPPLSDNCIKCGKPLKESKK